MHTSHTRRSLLAGSLVAILAAALFAGGLPRIGAQESSTRRITDGLQVLYTFDEGSGTVVHDVSGVGQPLDLNADDGNAIQWNPGSLTVTRPTIIVSADAATRLIRAAQDSGQITIEAWITPADLVQNGPARIVSLSQDMYNQNFMMGQGLWGSYPSDVFDVRLRTATTDLSGQPSLNSPTGVTRPELTHVAYTRDAQNVAHLFVNGVEVASRTVGGNLLNWDAGYPLLLANELTLNRPWLGTYHLVAVYSQALTSSQVAQNFAAGAEADPTLQAAPVAAPRPPGALPEAQITYGLQALYTFDEGSGTIVHDVAGVGDPLDLTAIDASAITWYPGALAVDAPTIIVSSLPAGRLAQAVQSSNEFTLEAWLVPANVTQNGPARIVSNSTDMYSSNFTLGQGLWGSYPSDVYDVRLRTATTDTSGQPSLSSPAHSLTDGLTHVVYTRDTANTARIYVNGQEVVSRTLGGGFANWDAGYPLMLANELTQNRPWLGTYHLVAIYNKALSPATVGEHYAAGPDNTGLISAETATPTPSATPPATATIVPTATPTTTTAAPLVAAAAASASGRVTDSLQALYTFDEGSGTTVRNAAGTGSALDLVIERPEATRWESGQLAITGSTLIRSAGPVTPLVDALRASNAITIETWVTPANATQTGPARLITLSSDINNRDFMLGQGQYGTLIPNLFITRLRTTRTNTNGEPALVSPPGTATTALTHVVYTREPGGTARMYINGREVSTRATSGDFSNWDASYRLMLANETSNDRTWLGTYHLVAVYSRALTGAEVAGNFQAGAGTPVATLPTATATFTPSPTNTPRPTNTATFTPSPTNTPTNTATFTPSPTRTPTNTATFTPSPTNTPTNTATFTPSPTRTPTNTATVTPSPTNTPRPTNTATFTPSPTNTATFTPSPTRTPTNTPTSGGFYNYEDGRVTDGLQTLYTFNEGTGNTVRDVSGIGPAEDLTINTTASVVWQNGSLAISAPVTIASAAAPAGLIQALVAANAITLEAWIVPTNATQTGPARIMTLSEDIYSRDFTLGQGQSNGLPADVYVTRLRTTRTDTNGEPSLVTPAGAATTSLTHLVYTRDAAGTARLYINGQEAATRQTSGDFSNWSSTYRLALANELTNDRPWLGTYHLAAIYSRALSAQEVLQNYGAGADPLSAPLPPTSTPAPGQPTATPIPTSTPTVVPTLAPTSTPVPGAAVQPVSFWEQRFLNVWQSEHDAYFNRWATEANAYYYYFLAYAVDGNLAMYEATGKTQYLDRALYYINEVVRDARVSSSMSGSQYRDNYLGWLSVDDGNVEAALRESYLWRYVTRLLRIVRETPSLYNNAGYRAQYDSLLAFTETNIWDKWYNRGTGNIYRSRTHMAAHWAYIALDLSLISTRPAAQIAIYREVYTKINNDLRNQIIPNPVNSSAYFWSDVWGSYDRPGQDTMHGNNVISYMVEARDRGTYWTTAADLAGLRNLLMNVIWDGNLSNPNFAGYFDGTTPIKGYFQADGFIKLGRYDVRIQQMYENYHAYTYYLTQFYGNGALNARRLLGGYW